MIYAQKGPVVIKPRVRQQIVKAILEKEKANNKA